MPKHLPKHKEVLICISDQRVAIGAILYVLETS